MAIHDAEYYLNRGSLKVSAEDTFASLDDLLKVFGLVRAMVEYRKDDGTKGIQGGAPIPGFEHARLWWPFAATPQLLGQNRRRWWYNIFEDGGDTITEFNNNEPECYRERLDECRSPESYRIVFRRNPGERYLFIGIYKLDVARTIDLKKAVWRRNTEIGEIAIGKSVSNLQRPQIELNEQQKAFVGLPSGMNIRLLAPAGSGKTQTLLFRCKKLLDDNPNQRILLVTFTRKACEELKARLIRDLALNRYYSKIEISTLNSFGNLIVRRLHKGELKFIEESDFGSRFLRRVVSAKGCSKLFQKKLGSANWVEKNAKALLKMVDCFKSLGFDHELINTAQAFIDYWSSLVNLGAGDLLWQWLDDFQSMELVPEKGDFSARMTALYENFWLFCQSTIRKMWHEGLYTLEDQKYWGWRLIKDMSKTNAGVRYNHIMVDEFQDINPLDLNFIEALRDRYDATMTIVGDDDQAIFEWRGAIPEYILHPEKHFERDFVTQILETNYRSPRNIVAMAKNLIGNNKNRVKKEMSANQQIDAEVVRLDTSKLQEVVEAITQDAQNNRYKSIAVMTRKRSHLLAVQMQLVLTHIPFVASGDINLFMSSAFKSLSDMLQLKDKIAKGQLVDRRAIEVALGDVLALLADKPLSEERRKEIQKYLSRANLATLEDIVPCVADMPNDVVGNDLSPAAAVNALARFLAAASVSETIHVIGEYFSGLKRDFSRADEDIFFADPPFDELERLAASYEEDFDLFRTDVEQAVQKKGIVKFPNANNDYMNGEFPKIELTTALRTKGGQFDVVYVLHANKDTWPIKHAKTDAQLEAERRLFYVSITRTQQKLVFVVDKNDPETPYLGELGKLVVTNYSVQKRSSVKDVFERLISPKRSDAIDGVIRRWHRLLVDYSSRQEDVILPIRLYENLGDGHTRRRALTVMGNGFAYVFASNSFARLILSSVLKGYTPPAEKFSAIFRNFTACLGYHLKEAYDESRIAAYPRACDNTDHYLRGQYLAHIHGIRTEPFAGHDDVDIEKVFPAGELDDWKVAEVRGQRKPIRRMQNELTQKQWEVARALFLRFLDPINCFLVSGFERQQVGEAPGVVNFMKCYMRDRFLDEYAEFCKVALVGDEYIPGLACDELGKVQWDL